MGRGRLIVRCPAWHLCAPIVALTMGCVAAPVSSTAGAGYARRIESAGDFVRYDGREQVAGDLEVATRTYAGPSPATVTLVGMVHFADPAFYEQVRAELSEADVVLFEGVKGRERGDEDDPAPLDSLDRLIEVVRESTGLAYQSDALLTPDDPRFVWADLDAERLQRTAQALGVPLLPAVSSTALSFAMGAIRAFMFLNGLDAEERLLVFRHMLAEMLAEEDASAKRVKVALRDYRAPDSLQADALDTLERKLATEGRTKEDARELRTLVAQNYCILVLRDDRVLEVLNQVLAAGKAPRVAILYGAEHMWDIAERLEALGWRQVRERWRVAWRIQSPR